jgi:transformation/transcription domain-associated protein
MLNIQQSEEYASRLKSTIPIKVKLQIVLELRESLDIIHTTDSNVYLALSNPQRYLSVMLPVYIDLLKQIPPAFTSDALEHRVRLTLLEIVQRLQGQIESLKPFVPALMNVLLELLVADNDENAVVALKIM